MKSLNIGSLRGLNLRQYITVLMACGALSACGEGTGHTPDSPPIIMETGEEPTGHDPFMDPSMAPHEDPAGPEEEAQAQPDREGPDLEPDGPPDRFTPARERPSGTYPGADPVERRDGFGHRHTDDEDEHEDEVADEAEDAVETAIDWHEAPPPSIPGGIIHRDGVGDGTPRNEE